MSLVVAGLAILGGGVVVCAVMAWLHRLSGTSTGRLSGWLWDVLRTALEGCFELLSILF